MMSGGSEPHLSDPSEAFYRRAWGEAVRWATALTGSVAAGEDLAQDALLVSGAASIRSTTPMVTFDQQYGEGVVRLTARLRPL